MNCLSAGDESAGVSGDELRRGIVRRGAVVGVLTGRKTRKMVPEGVGGAGAEADGATVLFNEAARDPEAQTCADGVLGGEEGREDALANGGGMPVPSSQTRTETPLRGP